MSPPSSSDCWKTDVTLSLAPILWDGGREQLADSLILISQKHYAIKVLNLNWKCYQNSLKIIFKNNKKSHLHEYVLKKVGQLQQHVHKVNKLMLTVCDMIDSSITFNLPEIYYSLAILRRKCLYFEGTVFPKVAQFLNSMLR